MLAPARIQVPGRTCQNLQITAMKPRRGSGAERLRCWRRNKSWMTHTNLLWIPDLHLFIFVSVHTYPFFAANQLVEPFSQCCNSPWHVTGSAPEPRRTGGRPSCRQGPLRWDWLPSAPPSRLTEEQRMGNFGWRAVERRRSSSLCPCDSGSRSRRIARRPAARSASARPSGLRPSHLKRSVCRNVMLLSAHFRRQAPNTSAAHLYMRIALHGLQQVLLPSKLRKESN